MISHQDKCIFIHIPKVAGQSIEDVFVKRMGLEWQQRAVLLLRPNDNPLKGPPRLAHLMADEYVKYQYVTPEIFNSYLKFSFVRNPWERLVSEYNYRYLLGHKAYQNGFRHFVLNQFPEAKDDNYQNARDNYRHVIPQTSFLYDNNGKCLVDFVGRFESLQGDFDFICKKLNIDVIKLGHKNKTQNNSWIIQIKNLFKLNDSKRKHYSEYYDDDTFEFVEKYYQNDITNFNYKFERNK